MAYIRYNPLSPNHRRLHARWRCNRDECRTVFGASLENVIDKEQSWAWCPACRSSSRPICEATEQGIRPDDRTVMAGRDECPTRP